MVKQEISSNCENDLILDLTPEYEVPDPREAIFNDYLDGIRDARETLRLIGVLALDGLIPKSSSSFWPDFIQELTGTVQEQNRKKC